MTAEKIVVVVTPDATTSHNALRFALRNVYRGHGSIVLLHVISSVPGNVCREGVLGLRKLSTVWRSIRSSLLTCAACTGRSRSAEAAHTPVSSVSGSRLARYLHEEVHPELQELKNVCEECKVSASVKVAMDDNPGQGTLEQATLLGATCLVFGKPSTNIGRNLGRTAAYCAKRKPASMAMFVVDRTGLLFQHQTDTQPKAPGLRVKLPDSSGSSSTDLTTSFSSFSISRGLHGRAAGGRLATSHTPSWKGTSVVNPHSVTGESPIMALPASAKPTSVFPTPPKATNIIKPAFVDHHMFFGQLGRAQSSDTHTRPGQQEDLLLDALKCGSSLEIPYKLDSFGTSMGTGKRRKSFTDVQERSRQEGPREELWSVDSGIVATAEYQSEQETECLSVNRQGRGTVRPLQYY